MPVTPTRVNANRVAALDFVTRADAAMTEDALGGVERNHRVRKVADAGARAVADGIFLYPKAVRQVLQFTRAVLVASRTIERMPRKNEFQNRLPGRVDGFALGFDAQSPRDWRRAGGKKLARFGILHKAEPARSFGREDGMMT